MFIKQDNLDNSIFALARDAAEYLSSSIIYPDVPKTDLTPREYLGPESLPAPSAPTLMEIEAPIMNVASPQNRPENHLLTKQDKEMGTVQYYDALVLFDEDYDGIHMKSIQEIVMRLERLNFSVSCCKRCLLSL